MDLISICDNLKELETYINDSEFELNEKTRSWNLLGENMIDLINKLPF